MPESGAGDVRDKYLRELEEYSVGKRKTKPKPPQTQGGMADLLKSALSKTTKWNDGTKTKR